MFGYSMADMGEFSDKVFEIVRQVPYGKVTTYGQVAALMGRPQSGRYVGFALRNNPEPFSEGTGIPCHRVLFKDGSLCPGFAFGGPEVQRELLQAEGVAFVDDAHVDLKVHLWDGRGSETSQSSWENSGASVRLNGRSDEVPDRPSTYFGWEAERGD